VNDLVGMGISGFDDISSVCSSGYCYKPNRVSYELRVVQCSVQTVGAT